MNYVLFFGNKYWNEMQTQSIYQQRRRTDYGYSLVCKET